MIYEVDKLAEFSNILIAQLKTALATGEKEEQKTILKQLKLVRYLIQVHYLKIQSEVKVSPKEIRNYIARSPEAQSKLNDMKRDLELHNKDLNHWINSTTKRNKLRSVRRSFGWDRI